MKITVTTGYEVVNSGIDALHSIVNEFTPVSESDLYKTKRTLSENQKYAGPAYNYSYTLNDDHTRTLDVEIEDGAILTYLPMAIKIAELASPFYQLGKTAVKMFKNVADQAKALGEKYTTEFLNKYGRPAKYCVARIKSWDLGIDDVIIAKDDGFGNINVVEASFHGESDNFEATCKIFDTHRKHKLSSYEFIYDCWEAAYEAAENLRAEIGREQNHNTEVQ